MHKIDKGFAAEVIGTNARAPLVTIVIVNHNYGEFIEQCIRSVDAQDYPHIQCVVVDCASTDNSVSVIDATLSQTRNSFFRLLQRQANHGQVINCLSVLNEVNGVFVTYLDSDDFLFPEFVSTHVKAHLNDVSAAALSVTDQIQVDAEGQTLAGTCHWHQKWRAFEHGTAWADLTHARSWSANSLHRLERTELSRLYCIPAWWSSWVADRWIWSTTSGIMFRKSTIESLAPSMDRPLDLRNLSIDSYFGRFAHSVGGTLVVDSAQGAYRRHGNNVWSSHQVLGGQTPNGTRDQLERFHNLRRVARQVLVDKHSDFIRLLGAELYYSIAWQLMANREFLDFVKNHKEHRSVWERTIQFASPSPSRGPINWLQGCLAAGRNALRKGLGSEK